MVKSYVTEKEDKAKKNYYKFTSQNNKKIMKPKISSREINDLIDKLKT